LKACNEVEQRQTERYANGICSLFGIKLPSFGELLAGQKEADVGVATSSSPLTVAPSTSSASVVATATSVAQNGTYANGTAMTTSKVRTNATASSTTLATTTPKSDGVSIHKGPTFAALVAIAVAFARWD